MMYELLTGKPVFSVRVGDRRRLRSRRDDPRAAERQGAARLGHVRTSTSSSSRSSSKEPGKRPEGRAGRHRRARVARARIGGAAGGARRLPRGAAHAARRSAHRRPRTTPTPPIALEKAIEDGADPADGRRGVRRGRQGSQRRRRRVARGEEVAAPAAPRASSTSRAGDLVGAERAYAEVLELDPQDDRAQSALDDVRRAHGKFAEVVESLMSRSETAAPGEELARIFAEIGRLCATELEDPDQGILAYARAALRGADRRRPWPRRSSASPRASRRSGTRSSRR